MKNVAVLTEDGAFAIFFCSHPRWFDSSRVPTSRNLPSKARKMLMPGAQAVGGGGGGWVGLGAAGIDWCIMEGKKAGRCVSMSIGSVGVSNILGNVVAFCTYAYLKGDVLGKMEEYSLILLIDCWTSFEGVFVNKWSYCWFPRDIMAATLDGTNKSISLHWELNPISCKFLKKNSILLSFNMATLSRGCKQGIHKGHQVPTL